MKQNITISHWLGGVVLIAAAALYLFTLDNGLRPDELSGGDLITHQYAQVEARPSNAPGYPLYTMGGWLWFQLGRVGLDWALNPIQILSLYSTLWGAASLFVLYRILLKVSSQHWPLAPLLTAFYAVTFFFWYYSVTTEQYTSAVFQTLLIIWLAFKWDDDPRESTLLWLAFISGTMLANMVTTLFILPPLLWFIFFRKTIPAVQEETTDPVPRRQTNSKQNATSLQNLMLAHYFKRPKFVLKAVGIGLLPLLSYTYIYIRGTQHPEWRGAGEWSSAGAWFIQFLTIQQGRDELAPGLTLQNIFTDEFPTLLGHELTWPIFWGGLIGLAFLSRRRAIFLYSVLLIYILFSWGYRFGNWFQVIIPAYPIFVIGVAAGLKRVVERARAQEITHRPPITGRRSSVPGPRSLVTRLIVVIFLGGLLAYRFTTNFPAANQRDLPTDAGLDPGWAILADRPDRPAVIIGDFEERVALQYLQTIWDAAPPVDPVDFTAADPAPTSRVNSSLTYITRRAAAGDPTLLQRAEIHPQAAGEQLIALWPAPRLETPAEATPLALDFGDTLTLVGWEKVESASPLPQAVAERDVRANWQAALFWRISRPLTTAYTVSLRPLTAGELINVAGEDIIQDHQPVWGTYPTSRWRPGEIVRDVYALHLPPEMTPDAVQIVVYHAAETGFENLGMQVIDLNDVMSDE